MIARSRALDRRRKLKRRSESTLADDAARSFQTRSECPLSSAISHEREQIVAKALDQLPSEQRETLRLAFFGGLSQREIAAKLQQPLGTVKTRVRLASTKLKRYLSVLSDAPHEQIQ